MKWSLSQIICAVLAALMLAGVGYVALEKKGYDDRIVAMNNALAERDRTIEVSQGLYEKASVETKDLKDILSGKDDQILSLKKDLDKKDQDLVTATNLSLKWKKDYEAIASAHQSVVPSIGSDVPSRIKVDFEKNFGPILVKGYTLTSPAEAFLTLHQQRPLRLTLAISQDKDEVWHTYATSSEENMEPEIVISGVNPWLTDPHWYEKISLSATVAAGGSGVLGGFGVGVDISQFTVSLMVFDHTSNIISPLYGIGINWRLFKQ